MRFVFFYHSLISDWNHGNAHFLRGITRELQVREHTVSTFEPANGWSLNNLIRHHGNQPLLEFGRTFPTLRPTLYSLPHLDLDEALDGADVVLVHEWNDPELVRRLAAHRASHNYVLLFHDTHHRALTAPESINHRALDGFDGVLAFGAVLRELYLEKGWASRVWTWHEAADVNLFQPEPCMTPKRDAVWIGNWGDEERTSELSAYFMHPVFELGLEADAFGVRYPEEAKARLASAGIRYRGWVPNYRVPSVLSGYRVALHIPRRPYVHALPGIPTIRVFETLACGIPLISSHWHDVEGLFRVGTDFLMAESGEEMREHLRWLITHPDEARQIADSGLATVRSRHTCAHRVDELLDICTQITGTNACKLLSLDPA